MKIAIAGATGTVGTHVVDVARERGHEPVPLTRGNGIDLTTGVGLAAALTGVSVVVDVAGTSTTSADASRAFFGAVTTNLLAAEKLAGVAHHVALSIVGIDGSASGYYAGKLEQERLILESGAAFILLRATQFHEFARQMAAQLSFGPITLAPAMRTQPVSAREVAERLVDLAEGNARGRQPDLAGPHEENLADMERRYLRATGRRPLVIEISPPGAAFREMRSGKLLPHAGADHANVSYSQWLHSL
ncbi:MAG: SDR family oxidoreductase [Microbacteriaceae bacterium]